MRTLKAVLAAVVLTAGISITTAAPASAALPTCTSWTTYYAPYTTSYVIHVPSYGYWTGTVDCLLKYGNKNDAVTVLQRALRYCSGYNIAIDGDYGSQTKAAVLDLQRRMNSAYGAGIAEDGIYGPQTRGWMIFPVWTWPGNTRTNRCDHSPA